MSYKMIVLDLDDTLLRDDQTISPRTKEALMEAQEMGVKVVLASGRPTLGMQHIADELSLSKYGSYILSYNGGKIINCETREEIFSSTLSRDEVHGLYDISRREGVYIHTYVDDELITEDDNEYTRIESELLGMPMRVVESFEEAVNEPVVKALMIYDPNRLQVVEAKLQEELSEQFCVLRSKPYFLEFTELGVTKGSSLKQLIDVCGIKQEEVIAIGDSFNDQTMIEFAGLGVAMGNAYEDIKAIANYVTDTNMNDGVAKVIEEFILHKQVMA